MRQHVKVNIVAVENMDYLLWWNFKNPVFENPAIHCPTWTICALDQVERFALQLGKIWVWFGKTASD